MRYSTLIVPIALLAIPATANAAGCQPAFVGADQTVMVDGVDIGSLNSAVRDFSVRVQNKAGPSGQPGAMDAAPCGATIRIARVGASSNRSEEHKSELQSLMRISYAVFCLKKKNNRVQTEG